MKYSKATKTITIAQNTQAGSTDHASPIIVLNHQKADKTTRATIQPHEQPSGHDDADGGRGHR